MDIKSITESNREAWNQALTYHQKAKNNSLQSNFANPEFTTFNRVCDDVLIDKIKKVNISGKAISQIPCNNGKELLSLMRFGAKEAIGFDISDVAIEEAKQLAKISGLNAKFERVDILEINSKFNEYFDFIYISEGSLQWFPDMNDYFSIVSKLLKENGKVLIFEIHPFTFFYNIYNSNNQNFDKTVSYFSKEPLSNKNGVDYISGVLHNPKECYLFMHKISDVINALLQNGITIQEFNEYNFEMTNNEAIKFIEKIPNSYILIAKKEMKHYARIYKI